MPLSHFSLQEGKVYALLQFLFSNTRVQLRTIVRALGLGKIEDH